MFHVMLIDIRDQDHQDRDHHQGGVLDLLLEIITTDAGHPRDKDTDRDNVHHHTRINTENVVERMFVIFNI
jgi:rhodanese-related sulfurtransferase